MEQKLDEHLVNGDIFPEPRGMQPEKEMLTIFIFIISIGTTEGIYSTFFIWSVLVTVPLGNR